MKTILCLFIVIFIISCQQTGNTASLQEKDQVIAAGTDTSCYALTDTDSVYLQLIGQDSAVTGTLEYRLKEKDANTGTLTGYWSGDTLLAIYNYQSEGSMSRRPVIFLRQGNKLTEGYGPISAREFSLRTPELSFQSGLQLTPTDCRK